MILGTHFYEIDPIHLIFHNYALNNLIRFERLKLHRLKALYFNSFIFRIFNIFVILFENYKQNSKLKHYIYIYIFFLLLLFFFKYFSINKNYKQIPK